MEADRALTPLELRAAEAVIAAEKLGLMLEILHQDASRHADKALARAGELLMLDGGAEAMTIATDAIDLAAKIAAMRVEMAPLLADITAREAQAEKERRAPTMN